MYYDNQFFVCDYMYCIYFFEIYYMCKLLQVGLVKIKDFFVEEFVGVMDELMACLVGLCCF